MVEGITYRSYEFGELLPEDIKSKGLVALSKQDLIAEDCVSDSHAAFVLAINCCRTNETIWRDENGNAIDRFSFLALSGEKAVGLYSVLNLGKNSPDLSSAKVWNILEVVVPDFSQKAQTVGPVLMPIALVVDSRFRRQGIYRDLFGAAVDKLHPSVVVSASKSPFSVEARAKVGLERGYRTFFGLDEVTPGIEEVGNTKDVVDILGKVCKWLNKSQTISESEQFGFDDPFLRFLYIDSSEARVPDASGTSLAVANSFRALIAEQHRVNDLNQSLSIHKPLISVRADLL